MRLLYIYFIEYNFFLISITLCSRNLVYSSLYNYEKTHITYYTFSIYTIYLQTVGKA